MSKSKLGQQLILQIMDMAREAGLDAKNFLGRGTNVLKFPKQDEITPYKPNFLQSMKEFGQDSVTAVKNKLQDEMNFLTTSNDLDLQNYKNNLQDYLDFVVRPKQKSGQGIMGTKSAELVDMKTGKPFDPNVKTSIEERMGVPENVDPESPMGGMMGTANKLKALIDDIEGITPQQRAAMDAKTQKEIIEEFTMAGGREEDISSLLRESAGDVDFFKRNTLPKAKTVAELQPKNKIQLDLGIDAEDAAQTFGEEGAGKVIDHFEKFYQPSQIRYTIENSIEDEIVKLGKGNRDDVSEALLDVKRNAKQKDYFAELKDVAKKFDYDLDTNFYKNYEDTYTFKNDPKYFERLMKNVKVEDIDPEPFAEGGRVSMKLGGLAKLFKNLLKGDDAADLAKQEKIFREGPITAKFLDEVDQDVINPFVSTRDMGGRGGYGLYKSFDEMPAGLKAAELIDRVKTKDGGIDYERAEAFIGKKLKGNESIDELIEMIVTPQRIKKAFGGAITKIKDAPRSEASPAAGAVRVAPVNLPDTLQEAIKQFGSGPFQVGSGSPYVGRYDDDGILKPTTGGLMPVEQARQEKEDYEARRAKYLNLESPSVSIQTPAETIKKFNLDIQEPSTSPRANPAEFLAKLDQVVSGPDEQKQRMYFDYLNNYLGISNLFTRRS